MIRDNLETVIPEYWFNNHTEASSVLRNRNILLGYLKNELSTKQVSPTIVEGESIEITVPKENVSEDNIDNALLYASSLRLVLHILIEENYIVFYIV